ncbi:MAG: TA system VapC family ribonuclease toxin [Desulfohalobiaceae bacterium]
MNLPDINIWLALAFEAHSLHIRARDWFEDAETQSCAFCRLTQQGFLRLATNPSVFRNEALTMAQAWSCYDLLLGDERVYLEHEPADIEPAWRELTNREERSPRIWQDAYLAAFAQQSNLRIVTFDQGFKAYPGLPVTVLEK